MMLIVTHYTPNRGTTDFLVDYLKAKKQPFYLLKHPFSFIKDSKSLLYFFDGEKEKLVNSYFVPKFPLIEMIANFLVTFFVSLKLANKTKYLIGFSSFNTVPLLLGKKDRKVIFWGVDYSKKRFGSNFLLNWLYFVLETISSSQANLVISANSRQEKERAENHHLTKGNSMIIPNGIKKTDIVNHIGQKPAFIYIGSITPQHGITNFVSQNYLLKNEKLPPLHIFGGGEKVAELNKLLEDNPSLNSKVYNHGTNTFEFIKNFIAQENCYFIGLAPYDDSVNDHVYFGDSLKIKEYLSLGLPYISTKAVCIPENLKKFGLIIDTGALPDNFLAQMEKVKINELSEVLQSYLWDNLFRNFYKKVKEL